MVIAMTPVVAAANHISAAARAPVAAQLMDDSASAKVATRDEVWRRRKWLRLACVRNQSWIAVADAAPEVRALARWTTPSRGGRGAVREVADRLLSCRTAGDPEMEWVRGAIWSSLEPKREIANSSDFLAQILRVARATTRALKAGGRVFFFGNGGSAADAQHLAAELVGRFVLERRALPAMALTVNSSVVTAVANDYTYDVIFVRQLEAWARPGDVAIGITTSGNSPNVVRAIEAARKMGLYTVALTGARGGQVRTAAEECMCVPSTVTSRIQESHILLGHILCEYVEQAMFGQESR